MGVILCSTHDERVKRNAIFAKSAIDLANEPYLTVYAHASKKADSRALNLFGEGAEFACIMLKKPQVYGCVVGVNEKMFSIGYNPMFTNLKDGGDGRSSYADLCRLILQRCENCEQAVALFKRFLEKYTPAETSRADGDWFGATFLFGDKTSAYTAEIAGKHWAIKKVEEFEAAANEPIILDEFDECNPEFPQLSKKDKPNFAECFNNKNPFAAGSTIVRRFTALEALFDSQNGKQKHTLSNLFATKPTREDPNGVDFYTAYEALTSHAKMGKPTDGPCTHSSKAKTAGSIIVDISLGIVYISPNSSLPCCSLYIPVSFGGDLSFLADEDAALDAWYMRETLVRNCICKQVDTAVFAASLEREQEWLLDREQLFNDDEKNCTKLNRDVTDRANSFYAKAFGACKKKPPLFSFRATAEGADYQAANQAFFADMPQFDSPEK